MVIGMKVISHNHLSKFKTIRKDFRKEIPYDTIQIGSHKYTIKNFSVKDGTYTIVSDTNRIKVSKEYIKSICE